MTGMMENVLAQFETLMDVVRRATRGDYAEEIAVTGDHPVGRMADGLRTVFADIVATKQQLADAERRLLAADRGLGVFELSSDGVIRQSNQVAASMLGYLPSEIDGRAFRSLFDPEQSGTKEIAALWDCFSRELPQTGEFRWLNADGDSICVWVSLQPINGPEETSRYLVHALRVNPHHEDASIVIWAEVSPSLTLCMTRSS